MIIKKYQILFVTYFLKKEYEYTKGDYFKQNILKLSSWKRKEITGSYSSYFKIFYWFVLI